VYDGAGLQVCAWWGGVVVVVVLGPWTLRPLLRGVQTAAHCVFPRLFRPAPWHTLPRHSERIEHQQAQICDLQAQVRVPGQLGPAGVCM
jgi:hypothetical protein